MSKSKYNVQFLGIIIFIWEYNEVNDMMNFKTKIGNPLLLGATKLQGGVNFAVMVENASSCPVLRIYEKGTYNIVCNLPFDEKMKFGDIFAMEIERFNDNLYDYGYLYDGKPYPDMYARVINHREVWGAKVQPTYSVVPDRFTWNEAERKEIPFDEAIIYRLHVKGFTAHKTSKTRNKGTFKGIIDKLPYLKELGVNVIEIMPAYEFDEVPSVFIDREKELKEMQMINPFIDAKSESEKVNYWGYTTASYFAPKASFASGKGRKVSIEFKEMVQAIHNAGMELIMEFHFDYGMKPLMVMDCIRYWVMEYHIDGIHMNLDSVPVNMIKNDPLLSNIKILGDRWELVNDYYMPRKGTKHLAICNDGYMGVMRRFLKGDEGMTYEMSMKIKDNPKDAGIINYLSTHNSFTLMDSVSYDRKHNEANGENNQDGNNLNYSWNCGFEGQTRKKKIVELRRQLIRNAITMLMVSQGTPMIVAGDEMGRSCQGNNNPYCQDNDINYINWNDLNKNSDIFEFTKFMINFRKEHKILHMAEEIRMMDYLSKGCPDLSVHGIEPWRPDFNYVSRCFGVLYNEDYSDADKEINLNKAINQLLNVNIKNNQNEKKNEKMNGKIALKTKADSILESVQKAEDKKGKLYIMFNMYWEEQEFNIPAATNGMKWKVMFSTADEAGVKKAVARRTCTVAPRSITVLCEV